MLNTTLTVLPGIEGNAEKALWEKGCLDWRAIDRTATKLSEKKLIALRIEIESAYGALENKMWDWFLNRLKGHRRVRVLSHAEALYVDVETNGLGEKDIITVASLREKGVTTTFVAGRNLHEMLWRFSRPELIVTFNGQRFDLPRLRKHFKIDLMTPHLDLMPVLADLGFKGGQKACEKTLKLTRGDNATGDGALAVELWNQYLGGNAAALDRLIAYNRADVEQLEKLAQAALVRSMSGYPIPELLRNWSLTTE